ncbi:MAG: tRNA epoxyqueuosine(34) reductase QueG [Chitinophagaceae bacterium]|jgi:epoxyqueuosine reductase|nr:tRNA epoxyqueuosine(34) reductase QueG [Chitinophagaceae bacterium]
MPQPEFHTKLVKQFAAELGFFYCGIATARQLDEDARRLENWLQKGMHGQMQYMENHFDLRIDPCKLVPGAKSVITLLKNYFPAKQQENDTPRISKYAYGNDYHDVIRAQLKTLLQQLSENIGEIHGRGFVDSAPVLERSWATHSGAGWIGKNGNLITKEQGSFFFIATLIVDIPLIPDPPFTKDYCGTCTRCIDACPTDAILPDKTINGSQCISYFTIELKEALIPDAMKGRFENWMFGCDTCQDVCPWNRFSRPHQEPAFEPIPAILNLSTAEWEDLSELQFREIFRNSPLKRSKYQGIRRNLQFLQGS